MKNLLLLLIIILAFGCAAPVQEQQQNANTNTEQPDEPETTPEPPDVIEPPPTDPPQEPEPVYTAPLSLFAFSPDGNLFYDGTNWIPATYEKQAGPNTYMIGDQIYTLDEFGNSANMIYAPEQGDLIKKTATGYVLCDIMTPQESLDLGAFYKVYSQIHVFSGGFWQEFESFDKHQWECKEILETSSGNILIKDTLGALHNLGSEIGIMTANQGGIFIFNHAGNTATAKTVDGLGNLIWDFNYFLSAKEWLELNGVYYSHNGYKYSFAFGFGGLSTAMSGWNSYPYPIPAIWMEYPVLIPVGVGDQSIYWLECNTGTLIEYVPSIDQIRSENKLYIGSGLRSSGLALASTLKPLKVANFIYFNYQGKVIRFDLLDGSSMIVLNSDHSIKVF